MFRLATCNEFIELREKYPQVLSCIDEKFCWGLKMNGYLLIIDQIYKQKPQKILEAGAGLNLIFFRLFGKELEYWMIDNGSLYPDPIKFREKISNMKSINFVDGLLGDFSTGLPDNYFDMIFSISVLEHTPRDTPKSVEKICKDMYRLLKPGGCILHTIDITPNDDIGRQYLKFIKKTGFILYEEPKELDWNVNTRHNQILLEKLDTVYLSYYEKHNKLNEPIYYYHFGSIIVMAFKPAEK